MGISVAYCGERSDSRKYVCIRRLEFQWLPQSGSKFHPLFPGQIEIWECWFL